MSLTPSSENYNFLAKNLEWEQSSLVNTDSMGSYCVYLVHLDGKGKISGMGETGEGTYCIRLIQRDGNKKVMILDENEYKKIPKEVRQFFSKALSDFNNK